MSYRVGLPVAFAVGSTVAAQTPKDVSWFDSFGGPDLEAYFTEGDVALDGKNGGVKLGPDLSMQGRAGREEGPRGARTPGDGPVAAAIPGTAARGDGEGDALGAAQLEMIARLGEPGKTDPKYRDATPVYWAGFVSRDLPD
jgi:hypothetical protein